MRAALDGPLPQDATPERPGAAEPPVFEPAMERAEFEAMVARIVEYVYAGDAFQVVPSQRWSAAIDQDAFSVYRGLRAVNPSPYMYFLDFGDFQVAGASPEPLLTVSGRTRLHLPDRGHPPARGERRGGPRDRAGAARGREGARRARDARGPRPQRPRPGVRVRQRGGADVHGGRDVLAT